MSSKRDIQSQLHLACQIGRLNEVTRCLDNGANIEAELGNYRWRALHWASHNGRLSVVELLLDKGAQIEAESNQGNRALQLASSAGHLSVVELLVKRGAQIDARNNEGHDALYYATKKNRHTVVDILKNPRKITHPTLNPQQSKDTDSPSTLDTSNDLRYVLISTSDIRFDEAPNSVNLATRKEKTSPASHNSQQQNIAQPKPNAHPSTAQSIPLSDLRVLSPKPLGSGLWGVVYHAEHISNSQEVALKLLHGNDNVSALLESFNKEWDVLSRLKHPNVVEVLHCVSDEDCLGYTMELMDESLAKRMRRKALTSHEVLHIALEIVNGLLYLHDNKMAHNDLKPRNVLLRETQGKLVVKLCDFGATSYREYHARGSTSVEMTPIYAAPERLTRSDYSLSADVYSFGILLNEMLTGESPFAGLETGGNGDALKRLVVDENRRPRIATDTPTLLREMIVQCWSRDPPERPKLSKIRFLLEQYQELLQFANRDRENE